MPDTLENLVMDLIEWAARKDHTYQETFDAWRTSCPRLTMWEEANDRGLVKCEVVEGHTLVRPTSAGLDLLKECRRKTYDQLQQVDT